MVDDTIGFETNDIPPASAASDILRKTKTRLAASGAQHRQGLWANDCAGALRLGHRDTPRVGHFLFQAFQNLPFLRREVTVKSAISIRRLPEPAQVLPAAISTIGW